MKYTGAKAESHYDNSHVYLMDCMDALRQTPDKYFDLAVVDPPYGIGANKMTLGNGKNKIYRGERDWDALAPDPSYFDLLKMKSQHMIIWGANHFIDNFPFNINSPGWIVWDKGTGENDYADGELAWSNYNKVLKIFRKSWVGANAKDGHLRIHPTQKPIALYDWIYHNYLPQGGKVIDSHLGSGSNRISADKAGNIEFYGFEIDSEYYEAQEKRYKIFKMQKRLF